MRKIVSDYTYPIIGTDALDWKATFDGFEAEDQVGHYPTEVPTVFDLQERFEYQDFAATAIVIAGTICLLFAGFVVGWAFAS